MAVGKKFILSKNFNGEPKEGDLTLVEFDIPPVKNGEILIQAEYLSVDPYMRIYSHKLSPGELMIGSQVAKIIESKNSNWPVGKKIVSYTGWATHTVYNPDEMSNDLMKLHTYIVPDFNNLPLSLNLGMLGMPGNTAYFGFLELCKPKSGETVVVSAAAGAIGSHVAQIAKKIFDMKVIGIVGSAAKCKWIVDELGLDHAINYKTENVYSALKKAAPEGIDCYFDNVGGEISSIVIYQMKEHGRISVSGSISCYNSDMEWNNNTLPRALVLQHALVFNQLKMEGFIVYRWINRWMEGIEKNLTWIQEGKLVYRETVTEGFENMFKAFKEMLKGDNIGKAIVKV